jgi:hypothetical protein
MWPADGGRGEWVCGVGGRADAGVVGVIRLLDALIGEREGELGSRRSLGGRWTLDVGIWELQVSGSRCRVCGVDRWWQRGSGYVTLVDVQMQG